MTTSTAPPLGLWGEGSIPSSQIARWTATTGLSEKKSNNNLPDASCKDPSTLPGYSTPPLSSHSNADDDFFKLGPWTESHEQVVTGPYEYVAAKPGKEFRSLLLSSFNEWLEVPLDSMAVIDRAVRMLHTSSLLIDDIQDNSDLRRGRPTAHKIFGEALTINSANYIYFRALQELSVLTSLEVIEVFTNEMLALHRGQAMDLFWRDTLTCPTEEDYFGMVSNKTGGLFRLAYGLMKAKAKTPTNLLPIVELLGVLFQVADDYKNLCSQEYSDLKGLGEDLTEGKFSFPVIHCINSNPRDSRLLHILQQRPTAISVKQYAIQVMDESGSLQYTREVIGKLVTRLRNEIALLSPDSSKGGTVLGLVDKITGSIGLQPKSEDA